MGPRDIGLFLRSARTDARLRRLRDQVGLERALDQLYDEAPGNDPWASAVPRYHYQQRKYDALTSLLPRRRYRRALDLGCGIGLLTERLAGLADEVLGLDLSHVAVTRAAERLRHLPNLSFGQAGVQALDPLLESRFDLVVVVDTLYYLPPLLDDAMLKGLALGIARLLAPDGILLLANHFFSGLDVDSRLSRRIHRAFCWSPALTMLTEHRRAFFLASLLAPSTDQNAPTRG